jgi:NAD(P)-dependent dehydrogenase (short-subunit alcohol dehydrogenase family)
MAARAAIVTGASSGIGFAIARLLAEEGHGLTVTARRAEKLAAAADELRAGGAEIHHVAADLNDEDEVKRVVAGHRERCGRLDVLVNNAAAGVAQPIPEIDSRWMDLQIGLNLRSTIVFYRECIPMLARAAGEHGSALVVNTSSITGKLGEPLLSVYAATKAGVIAFTRSANAELGASGIKSTALCPEFVDTPMATWTKLPSREMIQPADLAEVVRMLLRLSPACLVPEIVLDRVGRYTGLPTRA